MLKRNTRRVTLSSVDLENFLSEVSISDNQSQARRKTLSFQNNLSENMNKFVIPLNDIENVQPNILKNTNSIQLGSKVEKVSFINQTTTNLIPSQPKVSQEVENKAATEVKDIDCNVALSNEQIVRNYCKVSSISLLIPSSLYHNHFITIYCINRFIYYFD